MLSGNNGTVFDVDVGLMANPPVTDDFSWTLNGKEFSNSSSVEVMPGELRFTPLLVESTGNYSVKDCNNVTCDHLNFEFVVYCK